MAASATPLPISNPFQARFRAAELAAGEYHVLDEAGSDDESGGSDSDELDEDELMEMLDAGQSVVPRCTAAASCPARRRRRWRSGPAGRVRPAWDCANLDNL